MSDHPPDISCSTTPAAAPWWVHTQPNTLGLGVRDLQHWAGAWRAVHLPFHVREPCFESLSEQNSCSYFLEVHLDHASSYSVMLSSSFSSGCSELGRFGGMGVQEVPNAVMCTSGIDKHKYNCPWARMVVSHSRAVPVLSNCQEIAQRTQSGGNLISLE